MDKFFIFDQILDSVFVVNKETKIVYVNQVGSDLCGLSQKRLMGKKSLSEIFEFKAFPFPFSEESLGYSSPGPYLETAMQSLNDRGKSGRVQMSVTPWDEELDGEKLWVFILHDVSLEEALHSKYKSELEQKEGYIGELEEARAELEKYSKNLEEIVAQRTKELRLANRTLQAVIDSLGQGFMTFDKSGVCGNLYTKACLELLRVEPAGMNIKNVLKINQEKEEEFGMWTSSLFSEPLPFEDLKPLGPDWYRGDQDKSVFLEYFPIREEGGSVSDVVVVATDKTQEVEAQKKLDEEKALVEMILKFVRGQNSFVRFLKSVPDMLNRVSELAANPIDNESEIFRLLHTLEGEAGTFSLQKLRLSSRVPQQLLQGKAEGWKQDLLETINELKTQYDESVKVVEGFFGPIDGKHNDEVGIDIDELEQLAVKCEQLSQGTELASEIRALRFNEKLLSSFSHYDGLIQNIAEKLGKKVGPIEFVGGDMKVDVRPLREVFSSFVHLFRNVMDHGIEEPEEREFLKKPPEGKIKVEFKLLGDVLHVDISDDGRGIDPQVIRSKLEAKFPGDDFSSLSDDEVIQQVFRPNFSTKSEVGEFSGRGVGMDAVRDQVLKLNGEVRVVSEVGKGTLFLFSIPMNRKVSVDESQESLKRSA